MTSYRSIPSPSNTILTRFKTKTVDKGGRHNNDIDTFGKSQYSDEQNKRSRIVCVKTESENRSGQDTGENIKHQTRSSETVRRRNKGDHDETTTA